MNILELDSFNLGDAVKFNKELNLRIWQDNAMRPEVREKLLEIAEDFKEFLGLSDLDVKDITVSGSNAGYSYTPHSDIDLHLVVDIPQADSDEVYRELFDAKKYQYNDLHNIKIGGYDVELYVENANQPPVSQGVYSVLNNDWINIPKQRRATVNDDAVRSKYEDLKHRIDQAVESDDVEIITRLAEKIKNLRQAGLDKHGELGPENLAYKMLRTQGFIQKLYDARTAARDQELSLKERRKPHSVFTYGFKHEESREPEIQMEDVPTVDSVPTDEEILKDFINFCVKELKIKQMPTIKLRKDPQWSVRNRTFGRYINDQHLLEVAWGQRHIMDVLRTVAHELTHKHQHERDGSRMGPDAGETGSPYENEANARAGILMRDYGRLHPELFDAGQTELEESASGYIPTKKQAKDPRFSMALTQDIKPGQLGKEANKLKLKTDSQGHPQVANPNGLFEQLMMELKQFDEKKLFALADEDYSPDNPPGPKTKPTMPKGTVRVDVSDMYDWYKLGKNISNLKGADQSQFGKGPPSTIVSFGDEDTEHQYLKDLENLGLTTTDIDPVDPQQPKGIKRQKVDPTYNVNESQLDEVRMAPSNLKQFAMSPEAEGIQAGFEAELIFRDALNDDDGEDMEPDYDMDERCRSIQQVIDFFNNGEYGGLSQRQESALQNGLDEQYFEWQDEKMYDAFRDEAPDLVRDIWLEERPMNERIHDALVEGVGVTDQEADAIVKLHDQRAKGEIKGSEMSEEQLDMVSQYSEAKSIADDILDEDVQSSIDKQDGYYDQALDEFRNDFYVDDDSGFFDDIGLRWMSDVAEGYDLDWPYLTGSSNGGSRDWEEIGDSLNKAIDMPVKVSSGYHSATRKPGLWIVEPDSSLDPDDREDYGLEIVSPPMPLAQALEKLQQVTDWANDPNEGNAYTNSSTGLHMGVSIPYKEGRVDYLKLILFLGDEYVLKQYGREANTYTKAAMKEIKQRAGSEKNATAVLDLLKNNLLELAERELAKNTGEGKYTSAHKQGKYIEFRSAGGDWLAEDNAEPGKLENTMMRYAYAMYLAGRPDLERREYAKKLYKLVASGEDASTMALFSQYAAGELDKEQLKKRWAEKTLSKEAPSEVSKSNWKLFLKDRNTGNWVPVEGQEYSNYTRAEAMELVKKKLSPASSQTDFDKSFNEKYELRDVGTNSGQWRVYRKDSGETLEIIDAPTRGEAVDQAYDKYTDVISFAVEPYNTDKPEEKLSPRAKLAKRIVKPKQTQDYDVVYKPTGRVIDSILRVDAEEAQRLLSKVAQQHDFKNTDDLELRLKGNEAEPEVAQNFAEPGDWEFYRTETGNVIDRVNGISQTQANAVRADIVRRYGHPDSSVGMRKAGTQQTYSSYADAQRVANQQNRRADDAPPQAGNLKKFRVADDEGNVWGPFVGTPQDASRELATVRRDIGDTGSNLLRIEWWGDDIVPQSTNPNPTVQDANQVRMPNGMPVWEVYDKSTGSVINQLADHTMREAHSRMMAWLPEIGAEDPSTYNDRFGVRPKMLAPGERNLSPTVTKNFADGKGPGRPGDSQRHGIPKGATMAELEKAAKAPGRKGQLARWQLNMRRGKKK